MKNKRCGIWRQYALSFFLCFFPPLSLFHYENFYLSESGFTLTIFSQDFPCSSDLSLGWEEELERQQGGGMWAQQA